MKYSWDDDLREADVREWREWHSEAAALDEIKISRAFLGQIKGVRETPYACFVLLVRMPMLHALI